MKKNILLSSLFLAMAASAGTANAASVTWGTYNSNSTQNWSSTSSWSASSGPGTSDSTLAINFIGPVSASFISNNDLGEVDVNQLNLSGSSTVTGTVTIAGGTLDFMGDDAGINVSTTGSKNLLYSISSNVTLGTNLTVDASSCTEAGTSSGNLQLSGTIALGSNNLSLVTKTGGTSLSSVGTINLSSISVLTGNGNIYASGGFAAVSSTNLSWTGSLYVASGIVQTGQYTMNNGNALYVASGATTILYNNNISIGSLNDYNGGGGAVGMAARNARTLTLTGTGSHVFSGVIADHVAATGGTSIGAFSLSVTVNMAGGFQEFAGLNEYSGVTTITAGTLAVTNLADGGGTVVVTAAAASGATTLQLASVAGLTVGETVSIVNVLNGTTIIAIDTVNNTITLSQATVGTVESGQTLAYGTANALGISSNAASNLIIGANGTLQYLGSGDSTDRLFTLSGGIGASYTLDASGSGAVQFTNTGAISFYYGNRAQTLILTGTNSGDNLLAATLANDGGSNYAASLIKNGTGKWILSGNSTYTGTTTINAGTLQLGYGGTTGSLSSSSVIVDNGDLAISRSNAAAQGTDFSSSAISGSGSFTQAGTGSTTLNAANTFSGAVNVNNGTLAFTSVASGTSAQALGSGSTINLGVAGTSSGTLQYTGTAGNLDKSIYAYGNGLNTIENSGSGLLTLSGSIVKNGTILVLNGGTSGILVAGVISGSDDNSDLYITGGTTTLTAVNTYNGPTWVYGDGVLVNGNTSGALPTDTTLILGGTDNSNGTFDLDGNGQTVAGLSSQGSGTNLITNNGATTATLTVTTGGTYSGIITDGAAATALTVTGGNLVLNGSNDYTGVTTITGGTLTLNGSLAAGSSVSVTGATLAGSGSASGTVSGTDATINGSGLTMGTTTLYGSSTLSGINTVNSVTIASGTTTLTGTTTSTNALTVSTGAVLNNNGVANGNMSVSGLLKGSGTLNGNLTLSGTLAPGNSAGITTINGDLTMDSSAVLSMEIAGTSAGTSYDRIKVSGDITLAGTLDLSTLSGLTLGDTITLINNTGTTTTTSGYFTEIITSGSTYTISGSSSTYTLTISGTEYLLNYAASADEDSVYNDVTLTVVPEPTTWACVIAGVGTLLLLRRARFYSRV